MYPKLGHYSCDGYVFSSKIQALIYANTFDKDVRWYFNDVEFGRFDWSIEPEFTLDELYDLRARQIREQYDYIILSYSGGADSNNILESFIRQGLHIDEVMTSWTDTVSSKFMDLRTESRDPWNNNAEYKLNTVKRLHYIRTVSPNTKITVLDTSQALMGGLLSSGDTSWAEHSTGVMNVNGLSKYNITYFSDVKKLLDKGKRIGFIIGTDKPKIRLDGNDAFMQFSDKTVGLVTVENHIKEYPNATPVLFYWDPDALLVMAKQAHIVLKKIRENPRLEKVWRRTDIKSLRVTHENLLRHMIYPSTWKDDYWQVNKATKEWDSEHDYWFSRGWRGTREHEIWVEGLRSVIPKIRKFVERDSTGMLGGTKTFLSPRYFIGKIK